MYIVFFLRENWVPGICMEQEKTVSGVREDIMMTPLTVTSYVMPLWMVVVDISMPTDLR